MCWAPKIQQREADSWIINWNLLAIDLPFLVTFYGPLRSCPETKTHHFRLQNLQDKHLLPFELVTQSLLTPTGGKISPVESESLSGASLTIKTVLFIQRLKSILKHGNFSARKAVFLSFTWKLRKGFGWRSLCELLFRMCHSRAQLHRKKKKKRLA